MKYLFVILAGASVNLVTTSFSPDPVKLNDFLSGEPQYVTERHVTELTPARSINLSEGMNIHQPYLLTSDKKKITLFDKQNFGFFQFDFSLKNIRRFGTEGRGPGEYLHPMSVGPDADGNLWISDSNNLKVDKRDSSGDYIDTFRLPSGRMPYRFMPTDSEQFVLFSLLSKHAFFLLDDNMEIVNSFLEIEGIASNKKGFLLDGRIVYDDNTIYYAGRRNGYIKAYTTDGELVYSREMMEKPEIDFINRETNEIRSSPEAMLDFAVFDDQLFILVDGTGKNRWRYLDVYDKNNGDYLHTYLLQHHTYRITFPDLNQPIWFVLGFDRETKDMILSAYKSPD